MLPTIIPEMNKGLHSLASIALVLLSQKCSFLIYCLFTGSNCPLTLQPLEVIPAPDNQGSFVMRHYHGWTVNGPVKWNKQQDT